MDKSDKLKEINTTITEPNSTYYGDIYNPGQTKEQLEAGKEVKSSKVAITGDYNDLINKPTATGGQYFPGNSSRLVTAGTGSQVITGVGFIPKMVIINAVYAGTGGQISFGQAKNSTTDFCIYIDLVNGASFNNARIIDVGASRAELTSLDSDGFTLNWTSMGVDVTFTYQCYG